jgi:hypothetical protein
MDDKPSFFKQIISKSSPESSMRFAMVFTYLFSVITVFSAWAFSYCTKGSDLGPNIIMLTSGILAIVTGGKVVQQYNEGQEKKVKDGTPV